ncbi:MAG: DUF86 domain-containing protein [Candidatus Riflebacteria bacterium]|nr:DUF86 domain-containing protein [Candidatus Riflebacteria bacterium]
MGDWAGFRNVLVHFHEGVDHDRCWWTAREDLDAIEESMAWVGRLT